MDKDKNGTLDFDEFCDWAMERNLDLDPDDDFEFDIMDDKEAKVVGKDGKTITLEEKHKKEKELKEQSLRADNRKWIEVNKPVWMQKEINNHILAIGKEYHSYTTDLVH